MFATRTPGSHEPPRIIGIPDARFVVSDDDSILVIAPPNQRYTQQPNRILGRLTPVSLPQAASIDGEVVSPYQIEAR
ncbi:hypothetical protein HJC99_00755 [Candidatus Saccharibacteria bacterium]|nr:hypothetical protein [Candidatus Saccharibacteria bacterium]